MKRKGTYWVILNLIALLSYFAFSVYRKEQILKEGELLLLELAPVDPRSLMQGDYMRLRYNVSSLQINGEDVQPDSLPRRGYCVIAADPDSIARVLRFQENTLPLGANERLIAYTRPNREVQIGAESYFFEEGTGAFFEEAKYGGLKIDRQGNSVLIGLFDAKKRLIVPTKGEKN